MAHSEQIEARHGGGVLQNRHEQKQSVNGLFRRSARRILDVLWGEHGDAFSDVFGVWLLWAHMSQTGCRYPPAKLRTKVLRCSAVLSFQLSVVSSVVL